MVTLLYKAQTVGPVCKRLAEGQEFEVVHESALPIHHEVLVRWGSANSAHTGEIELNSPEAILLAKDKSRSRAVLGELSPPTWTTRRAVQVPCVIRPRRHHGGNRFHVCYTQQEVDTLLRRWRGAWYATSLVDKESEYRVFVVQNKVICLSQRFPAEPQQIAWNLAQGGRLLNVKTPDWPESVCQAAIAGATRLGLDWTALDIAVDTAGYTWIFEANTAPGLRNPWTIKQIAKAFSKAR